MKSIRFYIFLIIVVIAICISCQNSKKEDVLLIAAASSMQYSLTEITKEFTKTTGIQCQLIFSSSGKITAQIREGAPYNIFISANMYYPNELYKDNFTTSLPKIYAFGKLVLWTANKKIKPSLDILSSKNIKHIAIANPKTAPYGAAALEVLKQQQRIKKLEHKFVIGESISQTNQFISSQAAEIGFTAMSVVLAPNLKSTGNWITLDSTSYTPIKQGIVIINQNKKKNILAEAFYSYISSNQAQEILTNYGYTLP